MMRIMGTTGTAQTRSAFRPPLAQPRQKQQKGTAMNGLLGKNPSRAAGKQRAGKAGKNGAGFSKAGMQAMLSAASSMKQAKEQGSVVTELEGHARVLESEIKMDSGRGVSTERKEEELAEVEQTAADAGTAQMSSLADVNQAVKEASRAEAEAAAEQAAAEKKADKNSEKTADSHEKKVSDGNNSRNMQELSGSADVSDSVGAADSTATSASPDIPVPAAKAVLPAAASLPAGYTPVDIRL